MSITEEKLYVAIVTLSTQDKVKLSQQLNSRFRRTIDWNKHQSDPKAYAQTIYLIHLVNTSSQGVNRLFALTFENEIYRTSYSSYYVPKVEIKGFNDIIGGKIFFYQPIHSQLKTYENIRTIATGSRVDYITICLLGYSYFKDCYNMIAMDLS